VKNQKWYSILAVVLAAAFVAACATPTPAVIEKEIVVEKPVVQIVEVEKQVVVEKKVVETVIVEVETVVERPIAVSEIYQRVDFIFTGAFGGEIKATQEGLVNATCFKFFGRSACLGEVPDLPGFKALALETGAHPMGTAETGIRLGYHFPPANGDDYIVYTHGGIAGGFYHAFVEGAPEMQPGDSLAAAGACGINSNIWQPYLTQGYIQAEGGDTFESLAAAYGEPGKGDELYEYNAWRMRYESQADLQAGHVLLAPDTWAPNSLINFGVPNGGNIFGIGVGRYRMPHNDPCIYLSEEALALRDKVLAEMEIPPLHQEVIDYRARNFDDARDYAVVYSGDWNEGSGWSWYGDPWIARFAQSFYRVAQGDMETFDHIAARWSWIPQFEEERPVTDIIIYRSSSDPPDKYRGGAFSLDDFLKDPDGTRAAVRAAYRGEVGAEDHIPFGALIADQSAQFREFNFTAARLSVKQ